MKIIIPIIAVLVIGGGIFAYVSQNNDASENSNASNSAEAADTMEKETSEAMERSTLASLFGRGENLMCDYAYSDDFGTQEGTVYVSGERVRGDFMMVGNDDAQTIAHIIRDDEYHYTWGTYDGETYGTKINLADFDADAEAPAESESDAPNLNYDHEYDFDCSPWSVDASKFTVPTDVTFTDISAQLKQINEVNTQLEQQSVNLCASCDAVTDETARASCRAQFNCE